MRMNKKELEAIIHIHLETIGKITKRAISKTQAQELGHPAYLKFDNQPSYGGYRIVQVDTIGGGHSDVFGFSDTEERVDEKTFERILRAFIKGLCFNGL